MAEPVLNYQISGEGPPLLLVHGWGVSFTIWRNLAPLLSPHYKLIIPELPGIGRSPMPQGGQYYDASAAALENLRKALEIPRWHVLGYSMGGWTARSYARNWPEAVDHLIFLCIARPVPLAAQVLHGLKAMDQAYPNFGNWMLSRWRLHALVTLLGFNGIPGPLARVWSSEIGAQPLSIVKQSIQDLPKEGRASLDLPDLPVRFIWGRTDALAVAPLRPGRRDVILPGGHDLPMTGAEKVASVVLAFLRTPVGNGSK